MTDDDRLRLIALDAEDLAVLSAHLQDAVVKVADISFLEADGRFVVALNRFAWEASEPRKRAHQRRRSALHFERVQGVKSSGVDRAGSAQVLELLAVRFEARESPSGDVLMDFAGGAAIRLSVECLEAQLTDLGPAWSTRHAPRHRPA